MKKRKIKFVERRSNCKVCSRNGQVASGECWWGGWVGSSMRKESVYVYVCRYHGRFMI